MIKPVMPPTPNFSKPVTMDVVMNEPADSRDRPSPRYRYQLAPSGPSPSFVKQDSEPKRMNFPCKDKKPVYREDLPQRGIPTKNILNAPADGRSDISTLSKFAMDLYESNASRNRPPLSTALSEIPQSTVSLAAPFRERLADALIKIAALNTNADVAGIEKQALQDLIDALRNGEKVQMKCMQAMRQLLDVLGKQPGMHKRMEAAIQDLSKIADHALDDLGTPSSTVMEISISNFCIKVDRTFGILKTYL